MQVIGSFSQTLGEDIYAVRLQWTSPCFSCRRVKNGVKRGRCNLECFLCDKVAKHLGPVVQSIISLTKSLVEESFSLTVLTKSVAVIFLLKTFLSQNSSVFFFFFLFFLSFFFFFFLRFIRWKVYRLVY